MEWTDLHARILGLAFEKILGKADSGSMAFVRCLTPDVVEVLANDASFAPRDWRVWRVADSGNEGARTVSADRAVEMREAKGDAVLLLVDTELAGARQFSRTWTLMDRGLAISFLGKLTVSTPFL